jgi:metal-sulfur cluster biosynthetic enzyme
MLVDVSYRFYSGAPYFVKDGRMEATAAFSLNYLRDDEWVFSGYSFDRQLWIDEDGCVHEGAVPPDRADHMWGVGFFHGTSRDAFVSLRLVHAVEPGPNGPDASTSLKLRHADAPTLHYPGHGQLWSRWALRDNPALRPGDRLVQRNAYLTQPYDPSTGAADVQRWMRRFRSPLTVAPIEATHLDAGGPVVGLFSHRATGQLARPGEGPECLARKKELWDALRDVRDDMFYTVHASIGSMGYVHDIRLPHGMASGDVEISFGMPHRGRPMYRYLADPVCARLRRIAGVGRVTVTPLWDPPWTPDRMDDDAWAAFGFPVPEA